MYKMSGRDEYYFKRQIKNYGVERDYLRWVNRLIGEAPVTR